MLACARGRGGPKIDGADGARVCLECTVLCLSRGIVLFLHPCKVLNFRHPIIRNLPRARQ